jgi:hypothetical protein
VAAARGISNRRRGAPAVCRSEPEEARGRHCRSEPEEARGHHCRLKAARGSTAAVPRSWGRARPAEGNLARSSGVRGAGPASRGGGLAGPASWWVGAGLCVPAVGEKGSPTAAEGARSPAVEGARPPVPVDSGWASRWWG